MKSHEASDRPARRRCKGCGRLVSRYEVSCPACEQELPGIYVTCPRCESLRIDFRTGSPLAGRPPGQEPVEGACQDCGLVWKPTMDEVLDATFDEDEERERADFRDMAEHQAEQILDAAHRDTPQEPSTRRASRSGCGGCLASILIPIGIVMAFTEPVVGMPLLVLGVAAALGASRA